MYFVRGNKLYKKMARVLRRIFSKPLKCIKITVLLSLFILILIALSFNPSDNDGGETFLLTKNSHVSLPHQIKEDEDLPSSNKNLNTPNSHSRLEELDFEPACEIKSEDAISAIRRAKTQSCKQEIVNKTCLIQAGSFYPEKLPNNCVYNTGTLYGRHLGCYVDEKNMKLLSSFNCNHTDIDSLTSCLDICIQSGLPYAGVKYGSECFCGGIAPSPSSKISDESCDMKCRADPFINIDGNSTLSVFETGLGKFVPRTPLVVADYQESIKIVFLLTLNGRALRQIHRLINSLYRSYHFFYIHVDSRQNYLYRKLSPLEKQFPNIKLASSRFSTIWGGASLLQMLLASMKDLFRLGWQWDFVINLSESDFPIKPLEKLERFLSTNKGLNFVSSHGPETQWFIHKQGLDKTFIECETHMWRVGERKIPRGIVIDGGSDWVVLSSAFVTYIVGNQDELLAGLDIVFKHTIFSPESFFHTVLRNSHFCNTYIDNDLRYVNWKGESGCKRQRQEVDWSGCSPNYLRTEDWPSIHNTKDHLVFLARKFDPVICQEIISRSEQLIGYKDDYLIPNIEAYWQNIYDTEDFPSSTNDNLWNHAWIIARHHAKMLLEDDCHIQPVEIVEINSYSYADSYKGNLILYKAFTHDGKEVLIETWYRPKKYLEINFENRYANNVKIFTVSSDYDENESMFRNFGNILGPFSKPVLLYHFYPPIDKNIKNLTVMWSDPAGVLADIVEIHVDDKNVSNIIQPNLKSPLLPGVWKVSLFEQSNQIVSTKFLITPFEHFSRKKHLDHEANIIHSGFQYSYKNNSNVKPFQILSNKVESVLLRKKSFSNAKNRINQNLEMWITNLSIEFYDILDSCLTSRLNLKDKITCGKHKFLYCALSEWSSLSPDPKGTIGNLNKTTGRLDRI